MSDTMETAPLAVPRDRSVEAGRAKRQAKASRESRIIESLNRGVSVAVIAEWEDVGEKRMRALIRDILAAFPSLPPSSFDAGELSPGGAPRVLWRDVGGQQPSGGRSRRQEHARARSLSRFRRSRAVAPSRCVRSARASPRRTCNAACRADSPAIGAAKA